MRNFSCLALVVSLLGGCSPDSGDTGSGDPSSSGNGGSSAGTGFGGSSASSFGGSFGGTGFGASSGMGGINQRPIGTDDCVAEVRQGEQVPLDIYIMFDLSCSMGCAPELTGANLCCNDPNARIHPTRSAVSAFLSAPENVGINAGIGYFGHMPFFETLCDANAYATAEVPIGPLPGQAQPIIDSLNSKVPIGETPTGPAIRGACAYTKAHKQANMDHVVVNLLVTDGVPETPTTPGCYPDPNVGLQDAMAAASECTSNVPQIPTYVLGVGQQLTNLNQIAAAGGSQTAYLVEGGDVAAQVLAALNAIRGRAQIPCEFQIPPAPPGETLNLNRVNVEWIGPGGDPQLVYFVEDPASCDPAQGGWYYDPPTNPSRILLCPSTCTTVETTTGGLIDIALGCGTIRPPM